MTLDYDLSQVDPETKFSIAMNVEKKRPGCVLIQAAMGGNSRLVSELFSASTWETDVRGMKVFTGTLSQIKSFAEYCNREENKNANDRK